jgi:hypothetical protein
MQRARPPAERRGRWETLLGYSGPGAIDGAFWKRVEAMALGEFESLSPSHPSLVPLARWLILTTRSGWARQLQIGKKPPVSGFWRQF